MQNPHDTAHSCGSVTSLNTRLSATLPFDHAMLSQVIIQGPLSGPENKRTKFSASAKERKILQEMGTTSKRIWTTGRCSWKRRPSVSKPSWANELQGLRWLLGRGHEYLLACLSLRERINHLKTYRRPMSTQEHPMLANWLRLGGSLASILGQPSASVPSSFPQEEKKAERDREAIFWAQRCWLAWFLYQHWTPIGFLLTVCFRDSSTLKYLQ